MEDTIVDADIPEYRSAGATDAGHARPSNQDAFSDRPDVGLWVVADGMGGYRDGDVASRMVCEHVATFQPQSTLEDAIDDLRQRMSNANALLHAAAVREIDPVQSGSTVAMLLVQQTTCAILWAGDSRVYRLRRGDLVQLTTDHTWAVQLQLDPGTTGHADHTITRAVGGEEVLLLDVRRDRVQPGDRFLLCSDGLTRELPAHQIADLLSVGDVRQSTRALIAATLDAGARDNVTVVVVDAA